jgi:hypothetical protein
MANQIQSPDLTLKLLHYTVPASPWPHPRSPGFQLWLKCPLPSLPLSQSVVLSLDSALNHPVRLKSKIGLQNIKFLGDINATVPVTTLQWLWFNFLTYVKLTNRVSFLDLPQFWKQKLKPGVVAQACNPRYLGGRDLEVRGSRPARAKSSEDPMAGHVGVHLSPQLRREAQTGGSCSGWPRHPARH